MMRLELVKRPQRSVLFSALSPFIAFALTIIAGAVLFVLLGVNPLTAFRIYFIEPISQVWQLHELAIKAAPLILIAVGLSVCYKANIWNIGAEGQFVFGAIFGSAIPVLFPQFEGPLVLPLMLLLGMVGGAAYAAIPAFLRVRLQVSEILTSLMLVYVAQLFLDWLVRGPWRSPQGHGFPQTIQFGDSAVLPELMPDAGRANWGFVFALVAAVLVWILMSRMLKGFEVRVLGSSPRAGRFAGFGLNRMVFFAFLLSWRIGRPCRHLEVSGAIGQLQPVDLARLRLHRHHRGVPWPPQSARHHRRGPGAGADLSRRRGGAKRTRHFRQGGKGVPGHAFVLRARLRHAYPLPHPPDRRRTDQA